MNIDATIQDLKKQMEELKESGEKNQLSMVVFSGELDKLLAAFIIATGAVAMGLEVVMFFTFWATAALRKKKFRAKGKNFAEKMFGFMLPKGAGRVKLSKLNMGGMGTAMMKKVMKKKNSLSLEQMMDLAAELGVKIYICEMSMDLMGFSRDEMIDYPHRDFVGVASFLETAGNSKIQLFV